MIRIFDVAKFTKYLEIFANRFAIRGRIWTRMQWILYFYDSRRFASNLGIRSREKKNWAKDSNSLDKFFFLQVFHEYSFMDRFNIFWFAREKIFWPNHFWTNIRFGKFFFSRKKFAREPKNPIRGNTNIYICICQGSRSQDIGCDIWLKKILRLV